MTSAAEPGQADHHLGESLAALVDGELSHDSRDRVLAHLATCPSCKAEADAQRELKSAFAASPLPAPPDGLLARLQSLPAEGRAEPSAREPRDPRGDRGGDPPARETPRASPGLQLVLGGRRREALLGPPPLTGGRGFRIHEPGALRAHRGHRLAFAAAGAVSLAAFAIGGAVSGAGAGAGQAPGGAQGALSSVAAGAGVTPASTGRPAGGRSEAEAEDRLPLVYSAQAAGFAALSAPSGPVGHGGQLLPLLGARFELVSAPDPAVGPAAEPSVLPAVSPR
ncbi:zf-HC2 domain-containing protein [Streptomyces sp. DSM 44917]|uniref:Zf-HC2 domain-containing protein n=1 Tax=Streptomyces boetiae TaxID=3075541 RepID=A0ABU2L812_9ACTN|nr:zf-HC2 domain-containing protein [Streptomyces sp. DSM 44917]MDT0307697.1 zf-HC2 domain-containing protein [Streptomyces sp. DSM 44917]